jgi:hypothetical protein
MPCQEVAAELTRLLAEVEALADANPDRRAIEPTLILMVELLRSSPDCRQVLAQNLVRFAQHGKPGAYNPLFGPGQQEAIEFTMHALRWPEVAECLRQRRDEHSNPSVRRMALGCLGAFHPDWDGRDVWSSYSG